MTGRTDSSKLTTARSEYSELFMTEPLDSKSKKKFDKKGVWTRLSSKFKKKRKKSSEETQDMEYYDSICDIPDKECSLHGEDPYKLFRFLDDTAFSQNVDFSTYTVLTNIDDKNFLDLVMQSDLTLTDANGLTVLHLAAQYLEPKQIEILLNNGCDIDALDSLGYPPIFYSVISNNIENMELFIKLNCNYLFKHPNTGRMAIHIAAQYGSLEVLRNLIERGISIDSVDDAGLTPVVIAAYYGKSEVCAYLIEEGANACIEDQYGVMGLMRISAFMPTIVREVLDTFVHVDLLKGEKVFQLENLLGSKENSFQPNKSFFHYVIWSTNLGIIYHDTFEQLIEAKWDSFANSKSNMEFLFQGVFLLFWTVMFLQPYSNVHTIGYIDILYIFVGIGCFATYVLRIYLNFKMLQQRFKYITFINSLFKATYKRELDNLHYKQWEEQEAFISKHGRKVETLGSDLKNSPALLLDFVVDILLFSMLLIKLTVFSYNFGIESKTPEEYKETVFHITEYMDLYLSLVVCLMWTAGFTKLAITENGSFVIYMGTIGTDLGKVGTIFIFVVVPAYAALYKTVYQRTDKVGWYEVIFVVFRMVIVDYDYDLGSVAMAEFPIWWMIASLVWIFLGSIVVLNILIAVMTESYSEIMEQTGPLKARVERARCITRLERGMTLEMRKEYDKEIRAEYSNKIQNFDPATDRDTIDVVKDELADLKQDFNKFETKTNKQFGELAETLLTIKEMLELYTGSSGM